MFYFYLSEAACAIRGGGGCLKKIKVKQIASSLRRQPYQRKNLIGLGLNKVNKVVELEDTPSIRGMINKVNHLVKVISEE